MNKPVGLQGFTEGAGRMGGNTRTYGGNTLELSPTIRVVCLLGKLYSLLSMTFGQTDNGPGASCHGL